MDPTAIAASKPTRPGHRGSGDMAPSWAEPRRAASWWAAFQRQRRHGLLAALSLLLLIAQQGAFLHELSHHLPQLATSVASPAGSQEHGLDGDREHDGDDDRGTCNLCLAYAGVDALAAPAVFEPPLLTGLRHAWGPATAFAVRPGITPAPRNRGPPELN